MISGRAAALERPSTERGRRTRAAIVAAAAELMYAGGIGPTSIAEVCDYCGVGRSQIYHYFTDKRELVRAVLDHQLEQVLHTQPRLAEMRTWRDFEAWSTALLARHSTPQAPLACRLGAFAHEVDGDPELRPKLAAAFAAWRDRFTAGFGAMREAGELRAEADPERLATAVLTAVQGGLLLARLQRSPEPLRAALGMATAHVATFRTVPTVTLRAQPSRSREPRRGGRR